MLLGKNVIGIFDVGKLGGFFEEGNKVGREGQGDGTKGEEEGKGVEDGDLVGDGEGSETARLRRSEGGRRGGGRR